MVADVPQKQSCPVAGAGHCPPESFCRVSLPLAGLSCHTAYTPRCMVPIMDTTPLTKDPLYAPGHLHCKITSDTYVISKCHKDEYKNGT